MLQELFGGGDQITFDYWHGGMYGGRWLSGYARALIDGASFDTNYLALWFALRTVNLKKGSGADWGRWRKKRAIQ